MGRPKNYDRDEVIGLAMETFWLHGYAATSMSDLTEATGLNKKSIYNEFGSKEDLFNIALDHYNQRRMPLLSLLQQEPLGIQNIKDFLMKLSKDTDPKGCLLALSINERDLLEEKAYKQVREDFQGLQKLIAMNLQNSELDKKTDPKALALLISSQMFSVAAMGKLKIAKTQIVDAIQLLIEQLDSKS